MAVPRAGRGECGLAVCHPPTPHPKTQKQTEKNLVSQHHPPTHLCPHTHPHHGRTPHTHTHTQHTTHTTHPHTRMCQVCWVVGSRNKWIPLPQSQKNGMKEEEKNSSGATGDQLPNTPVYMVHASIASSVFPTASKAIEATHSEPPKPSTQDNPWGQFERESAACCYHVQRASRCPQQAIKTCTMSLFVPGHCHNAVKNFSGRGTILEGSRQQRLMGSPTSSPLDDRMSSNSHFIFLCSGQPSTRRALFKCVRSGHF